MADVVENARSAQSRDRMLTPSQVRVAVDWLVAVYDKGAKSPITDESTPLTPTCTNIEAALQHDLRYDYCS